MTTIKNRVTGYLVASLLRHLGYDLSTSGDLVRKVEILPKSIRVESCARDESNDRSLFVGGDDGNEVAIDIREHPMHWPKDPT